MPPKLQKRLRLHVYQTAQLSRAKAFTPTMDCLSPGLQGEVALVRSAKWIDKVWYYREAGVNFIVDLSKELEPNVYACGERIRTRKVLFIIGNFGVVARAGKILISGGVWGEDMILRNEILIDQVCPHVWVYRWSGRTNPFFRATCSQPKSHRAPYALRSLRPAPHTAHSTRLSPRP